MEEDIKCCTLPENNHCVPEQHYSNTKFESGDKNRYRAYTSGVDNPTTSQRSLLITKETVVA